VASINEIYHFFLFPIKDGGFGHLSLLVLLALLGQEKDDCLRWLSKHSILLCKMLEQLLHSELVRVDDIVDSGIGGICCGC